MPDKVEFSFHPANDLGIEVPVEIPLVTAEHSSIWIQHKKHGQKVDVAAIEINGSAWSKGADVNTNPLTINDCPRVDDMRIEMGSDVFVLGFPLGIMKTGLLPVWKRGSIATELQIDVNDLPCFVIDTATREGMSGAPVIARAFGSYPLVTGGARLGKGVYSEFLGVYSGRFIGGIDEAQLGIVWKSVVIEQIIDHPAPGDFVVS